MSIQDIVIIALIGIFAVWGMWRGIIREAFDAAGLLLGVLVARWFAPSIGSVIPPKAIPEMVRTIIVSIVILLIVWVAVAIVGYIVRKIIRHGPVKSVDRLGGFLIGTLKGTLIVLALAVLLSVTPFAKALDASGDKAPVYKLTMKIAKPLGERYRTALKNKLNKSIAAHLDKALKKRARTTETVKSLTINKPSSLPAVQAADLHDIQSITDKMPPDVKQQLKGIIDRIGSDDRGLPHIQLKLDTLSPEIKQQMRKILDQFGPKEVNLGLLFDMAEKSGMVFDLSLDDLSPESRTMLRSLIDGGTTDERAIRQAVDEAGIDVSKVIENLGVGERK